MQPLTLGEVHRGSGELAVADEDNDVTAMYGAARAIEDMKVRRPDRGTARAVAAVGACTGSPSVGLPDRPLNVGAVVVSAVNPDRVVGRGA